MDWLLFLLIVLATQYVYVLAAEKDVAHLHLRLLANAAVLCTGAYFCVQLLLSAYYSDFTWGVPVTILKTDQGVIQLAADLDTIQTKMQQLETEILKLRKQAMQLTLQVRYLDDHLYLKLTEIQATSQLNHTLLNRIGPLSNIHLRNVSDTAEAIGKIAGLEVVVHEGLQEGSIEAEDGARALQLMQELRGNFRKTQEYKSELLHKLQPVEQRAHTRIEYEEDEETAEPIPTEPQLPQEQPAQTEPVPPVVQQVQPTPAPYVRGMSISDADSDLLHSGHKLMGDAGAVQQKLAETTMLIVSKLNELLYYRKAAAVEEGSALYRVSEAATPVLFLFLEEPALMIIHQGDAIYNCRFGLLWCDRVGSLKRSYPDEQHAIHPFTGKLVSGFLVEIELKDRHAARTRVLHLQKPF